MKLLLDGPVKSDVRIGFFMDTHLHHMAPRSRIDDYPEAILSKLRQIKEMAENWDLTLFGGDLFHSPKQPYAYLCRVMDVLKDWPCPLYGIVGNHDYRGSMARRDSATLAVFAAGLIQPLSYLVVCRKEGRKHKHLLGISGMDYCLDPVLPVPKDLGLFNILVAHQYQEEYPNCRDILQKGAVAESCWEVVLLGHDHTVYPTTCLEDIWGKCIRTRLIRPGSVCRPTKADTREEIKIITLVFKSDNTLELEESPLEIALPEAVFSSKRIEREQLSQAIERYVQKLQIMTPAEEKGTIPFLLENLCSDQNVKELCLSYLRDVGAV